MVGQFCDFKQIIGDPRHEDPGAVFIKKAEAQTLHVGIQVPSKDRPLPGRQRRDPNRRQQSTVTPFPHRQRRKTNEKEENAVLLLGQQVNSGQTG